jgi:uncharacterized membrane protein
MKSQVHSLFFYSVGFTLSLILYRAIHFEEYSYIFLAGNMFLAWIPLFISLFLSPSQKWWAQCLVFFGWLIFFPNSFYLITDLTHLMERPPVPYWFDIILVFSAVLNGILMGYVSFIRIEQYLLQKFNKSRTTAILIACLFLCSFGIYIGRFLRWNSWDVLTNPLPLASEIGYRIIHPFENIRTWGVTLVLTLFFSVFYFVTRSLVPLTADKSTNPE